MRNAASFVASQNGYAEAGLLHSLLQAAGETFRSWSNRRQVANLAEFDDYMLADIGLTRRDVREALDLPFFTDPGQELQARVARRLGRGWNN